MGLLDFLVFLSLALTVAAYGFYWWGIGVQLIKPNRSSWLIWSAVTTVEALTYQAVNEGLLQNIIFFVNAASCLFITFAIWRQSAWQRPSIVELLCMALALASVILWLGFHQSVWAHLIIVAAVPIGFLPTWVSAWQDKRREISPAWGLWTLADATTLALVLSQRGSGEVELPYIVMELVCHAIVWLLIGFMSIDPRRSIGVSLGKSQDMREASNSADLFEIRTGPSGRSIFARVDFSLGRRLCHFTGPRYHRSEIRAHLPGSDDRFVQIDVDDYMGPSGDIDDLFNHSCDPNAALQFENGEVYLVAIKSIKAGEEVCWDYSTTSSSTTFWMRCLCGSPKCRKIVGDFEFLEAELQAEYRVRDLVPPYLHEPGQGLPPDLVDKPLAA